MTITCRKKATRRKQQSKQVTTMTKLSNKDKADALSVYVNQLVTKKLLSTKKENRLNKDDYVKTLRKIMAIGINWVSLTSLKFRVLCSFNATKKKNPPPPDDNIEIATASSHEDTPVTKLGGRPKGTSLLDISIRNDIDAIAKKEITVLYNKALVDSNNNHKRVTNGTFTSIHAKIKSKYNLDHHFQFSYHSCMMRIYRGKPNSLCKHLKSLLKDVEERFVQIILALSDIGCPVTVGETINPIQALIEWTQAQQKLISYQRELFKARGFQDLSVVALGKISRSYYYNFMRRHGSIIDSNKGR